MRFFFFLFFFTFCFFELLYADTHIKFEWSVISEGSLISAPILMGENIYFIAQDRKLHIYSLKGAEEKVWSSHVKLYPYLMRGQRSGELYIVTMDNTIHKLTGTIERWQKHIPFLCGSPSLTSEGYLLIPFGKGGIKIIYSEDGREISTLKESSQLALDPISDSWGRIILAKEDESLEAYDSWGSKIWQLSLESRPVSIAIAQNGYVLLSLENKKVLLISIEGRILKEFSSHLGIIKHIRERADGSLILINEFGKITITDRFLSPKKSRHYGLPIGDALIINDYDMMLFSEKYWFIVNKDLAINQIFKGVYSSVGTSVDSQSIVASDTQWRLSLFSFWGIPLNRVNFWSSLRGDSYNQNRVRHGVLKIAEDNPYYESISEIKGIFDFFKTKELLKGISSDILKKKHSLFSLAIALNEIMNISLQEGRKNQNFPYSKIRYEIYDLLSKIKAPYSYNLILKYGRLENTFEGMRRIFYALKGFDKDPRDIYFSFFLYALEKFKANKELTDLTLDILEDLLNKSVYLNFKKVDNILTYILRQNISHDFVSRINKIRSKILEKI